MRGSGSYRNGFFRSANGSMTIEFVAFAPLLIAALVISYEFGRAFWAFDVVTRDVRAGVRYLARMSTPPEPPACPTAAQNIAETGLPAVGEDASKHFPWKGAAASFACSSTAFSGADFNDGGQVITMTADVPVTLTLLEFINRSLGLAGDAAIDSTYSLTVSYQARYIGN